MSNHNTNSPENQEENRNNELWATICELPQAAGFDTRTGGNVSCPMDKHHHNGDSKPSLTATRKSDGKILLFCHGCETKAPEIAQRLGFSQRDLEQSNGSTKTLSAPAPRKKVTSRKAKKATKSVKNYIGSPYYFYLTATGEPYSRVVRKDFIDGNGKPGKDVYQNLYDPKTKKYLTGMNRQKQIYPYWLMELLAATAENPDVPVLIPEGEKAVDRLRDLGFVATTNAGGAGKFLLELVQYVKGLNAFLLPDLDVKGAKHVNDVFAKIKGVAASVKIITFDSLTGEKDDVSDWLDHGGTAGRLEKLIAEAQPFKPIVALENQQTGAWSFAPQQTALPKAPGTNSNTTTATQEAQETRTPDSFTKTDVGNGQLFVQHEEGNIFWCEVHKLWYYFDGVYCRPDDMLSVVEAAKDCIQDTMKYALTITDSDRQQASLKHCIKSLHSSRITALLDMAKSDPKVSTHPSKFNTHPMLLCVENGTVDLIRGKFRQSERGDLLTQQAAVKFDETATCPRWDQFIDEIMLSRKPLVEYLKRVCGYCLTGSVQEQKLFLFNGSGSNGKGTLLEVIATILADYTLKMQSESLLISNKPSSAREASPDIASLEKKRFVYASETEENKTLAEVRIKELTGGDTLTARYLRQNPRSFDPTHKIILMTNQLPKIKGTDHAIWRRIQVLPFDLNITDDDMDKNLKSKLLEERSGILNWLLAGCQDWLSYDLQAPEDVTKAVGTYRENQDVLAGFLKDCCVIKKSCLTPMKTMYENYLSYCNSEDQKALKKRSFNERLEKLDGIKKVKSNSWEWVGLGLKIHYPE